MTTGSPPSAGIQGRTASLSATRPRARSGGLDREKALRGTSHAQDHGRRSRSSGCRIRPSPRGASASRGHHRRGDRQRRADQRQNGSWSIDHQRYNFQFSGQTFHEVKGARSLVPLRDVAYQSNPSAESGARAIRGGPKSWSSTRTLWDGKGEPSQSNAVSHGVLRRALPLRVDMVNNVNARDNG
jgi:hypothetical protein